MPFCCLFSACGNTLPRAFGTARRLRSITVCLFQCRLGRDSLCLGSRLTAPAVVCSPPAACPDCRCREEPFRSIIAFTLCPPQLPRLCVSGTQLELKRLVQLGMACTRACTPGTWLGMPTGECLVRLMLRDCPLWGAHLCVATLARSLLRQRPSHRRAHYCSAHYCIVTGTTILSRQSF